MHSRCKLNSMKRKLLSSQIFFSKMITSIHLALYCLFRSWIWELDVKKGATIKISPSHWLWKFTFFMCWIRKRFKTGTHRISKKLGHMLSSNIPYLKLKFWVSRSQLPLMFLDFFLQWVCYKRKCSRWWWRRHHGIVRNGATIKTFPSH